MKKTKWFDGNVKPARVGVYERKYSSGIYYSGWNGYRWNAGSKDAKTAYDEACGSFAQSQPWRGLAENPKGKQ